VKLKCHVCFKRRHCERPAKQNEVLFALLKDANNAFGVALQEARQSSYGACSLLDCFTFVRNDGEK